MHKGFYASGFLYNPDSQQILLQQQIASPTSTWTFFETLYTNSDAAEHVFVQTIRTLLHIQLQHVYPIYSYVNDVLGKNQDVFYAIYKDSLHKSQGKYNLKWFSFKEVAKLNIPDQVRHDIVVGHRVIEAAGRKARGEHTFQ